MVKIQVDDERLRQFVCDRIAQCSPDVLSKVASVVLSADISQVGCGLYRGEISNRELVRDEELSSFLMESKLDSKLLEVASEVDPRLELSQFRSALRIKLLKHGLKFDEDIFTSLCNRVRNSSKGDNDVLVTQNTFAKPSG